MYRLGWKRFPVLGMVALLVGVPFGDLGVGFGFAMVGLMAVAALVEGPRRYGATHSGVWRLLAAALLLFLVGGIADAVTADPDATSLDYPGWREPFDLAAYLVILGALWAMGRARQVHRDPTITLDALVTVLGVGSLAWAGIMVQYLDSTQLTIMGKATGVAFSVVTLMLGFATIRLAIGSGSRPPAYYLLAGAAAGGFIAELLLEIELVGWSPFGQTEVLSTAASATAFVLIGTAALHPSMPALTEPPADATPVVTARRLALMTVAVLIPPGLLMADQAEHSRLNAVILIGLWAVISVMVMSRIAVLALARERAGRMDRIVAEAEAGLATATTAESMAETVLEAMGSLVPSIRGAAFHERVEDDWRAAAQVGSPSSAARDEPPVTAGTIAIEHRDNHWEMVVHFDVQGRTPCLVTMQASEKPAPEAQSRIAVLVADLGAAMEAAVLRDLMARNRSERRFRALIENSVDIVFVLDDAGIVQFVTPAGPRLLGWAEDELMGAPFRDLIESTDESFVDALVGGHESVPVQVQLRGAEGCLRWFEVRTADLSNEPEIGATVVTASEISAQKKAELDLRRSEARFRSLVRHASDLVAVLDDDGLTSWISPSIRPLLGFTPDDVTDREFSHLVFEGDRRDFLAVLREPSAPGCPGETFELRVRTADGQLRTLETRLTDLRDDPNVEAVVLNAHDITERKKLEETLRHQVLHDPLTGIPNRLLLRSRIEYALQAREGAGVAVVALDLDDFKSVNDGLGHSVGDEVLKIIAFRLQQHLRASDTAARLSGDEFAVLLPGRHTRTTVLTICQRLLAAVEEPIEIDGRELVLQASAGVAFASDLSDTSPDSILRSADVAMYGAKNRGKSRVTVFDASMHEGAFDRLELKADLAHALSRDELALHYQPFVALESGTVTGFEALMRWHHPERGLVSPATFIPLAEETGLIVPIGRWLLSTAFDQLKTWQSLGAPWRDLTMSVNVSGRQLDDDDIVADIAEAIADSGIDPTTVVVELTESIAVEDSPVLVERLQAIRGLGVGLHADDFGSGFASYSALQAMPFTGVKLDRSLVAGLDGPSAERAHAQIRSIIDMANSTGMHVVAEGIESAAQVQALRALRCDTAQGFYFARPGPPAVAAEPLHAAMANMAPSYRDQLLASEPATA